MEASVSAAVQFTVRHWAVSQAATLLFRNSKRRSYDYAMTDLVSVSDAAEVLQLDRSRVRALAASGELSARKIGGVWLIDRSSIEQRREHPAPAGRPLSGSNAWRVLLLASGERIDEDADPVVRWRVREALDRRGLDGLRGLLRRHAEAQSFWGLAAELRRLRERDDVVLAGTSAAGAHHLDLLSGDRLDLYVSASRAPSIERTHALQPAATADANVVLRLVPDDAWPLIAGRRLAPLAAVAIALAEDPDPRAARVGREVIERISQRGPAT
jgi:excisionase family DNA binding protein